MFARYILNTWRHRDNPGVRVVRKMSNCTIIFAACMALTTIATFFGLFFGLLYSEISINQDYIGSSCRIDASNIMPSYCSQKVCDASCTSGASSLPQCVTVLNIQQHMDPRQCAPTTSSTNKNNQTQCAKSTLCTDGYQCCEYTYSQCFNEQLQYKNINVLAKDNCTECVKSVDLKACTIVPQICYASNLNVTYEDKNGNKIQAVYVQQQGTDVLLAIDYIVRRYQLLHDYDCWYNQYNGSIIRWDIAYTKSFLIGTCLAGLSSIFALFFLSYPLVYLCLEKYKSQLRDWSMTSIFIFLWAWMIGYGALLPIYYTAAISKSSRIATLTLFYQIIVLGLAPYVYHRYDDAILIAYFIVIWLTMGVMVPVLSWYTSIVVVTFFCAMSTVLFVLIVYNSSLPERRKIYFFHRNDARASEMTIRDVYDVSTEIDNNPIASQLNEIEEV
jgi:hypothetical protein